MAKKTKDKFKKERKPLIYIVCEGRNKTERTYFNNFQDRNAPFVLHIRDCEDTDILNMAKRAAKIYVDNDMDVNLGDKVYCMVDLDLEQYKFDKFIKAKAKYKNIEIIPSNPCFEIWLLYYFTKHPKVLSSSQKVKAELCNYVPGYTESTDVIKVANLGMNEHVLAINNSETKNSHYDDEAKAIDRNPYTEVANVVTQLIQHRGDA